MVPPISQSALIIGVGSGIVAFLPPIAAAIRRRFSWQTQVGQVAFLWLVMAVVGLIGMLRFYFHYKLPFALNLLSFGIFPLLTLTPTLTWIGPRAVRWRWPAIAAWSAVWVVTIASTSDRNNAVVVANGRMLMAMGYPVMSFGMLLLSVWALANRILARPEDMRRQSWYWILIAHVMYFALVLVRGPVIEVLQAWNWDAMVHVSNGIELLYCVVYLLLARGFLVSGRETASRRVAPAAHPQPAR